MLTVDMWTTYTCTFERSKIIYENLLIHFGGFTVLSIYFFSGIFIEESHTLAMFYYTICKR